MAVQTGPPKIRLHNRVHGALHCPLWSPLRGPPSQRVRRRWWRWADRRADRGPDGRTGEQAAGREAADWHCTDSH